MVSDPKRDDQERSTEQEEAFRQRIGDEPADAKGHDRYPGDSEEDAAERRDHDPDVPIAEADDADEHDG